MDWLRQHNTYATRFWPERILAFFTSSKRATELLAPSHRREQISATRDCQTLVHQLSSLISRREHEHSKLKQGRRRRTPKERLWFDSTIQVDHCQAELSQMHIKVYERSRGEHLGQWEWSIDDIKFWYNKEDKSLTYFFPYENTGWYNTYEVGFEPEDVWVETVNKL